jgi:hypothetical protein
MRNFMIFVMLALPASAFGQYQYACHAYCLNTSVVMDGLARPHQYLRSEGSHEYRALGITPDDAWNKLAASCRVRGGNHLFYYYNKVVPRTKVGFGVGVNVWRRHVDPRVFVGPVIPRPVELINMTPANRQLSCGLIAVASPVVPQTGAVVGPGGEILSTPALSDPGFIGGVQ